MDFRRQITIHPQTPARSRAVAPEDSCLWRIGTVPLQRHVTHCYTEENNNSPPTRWRVAAKEWQRFRQALLPASMRRLNSAVFTRKIEQQPERTMVLLCSLTVVALAIELAVAQEFSDSTKVLSQCAERTIGPSPSKS
jgi:hypothetical protein